HDGGVYPCDFFVEPQYRLGSIMDENWRRLRNSPVYHAFATQKNRWNDACDKCDYLDFCSGDCLKLRFRMKAETGKVLRSYGNPNAGRNTKRLSYLCEGQKRFFEKTIPLFTEIAQDARMRVLHADSEVLLPPVQRKPEQLCFCGSGKKYKNCHMVSHIV
ncbi:MAG: SPASM domain-containing protein, partial [Spirochaetaceae bacterium]